MTTQCRQFVEDSCGVEIVPSYQIASKYILQQLLLIGVLFSRSIIKIVFHIHLIAIKQAKKK